MNIKEAAAAMGRKGGRAGTGFSKRRSSDQARQAVETRWRVWAGKTQDERFWAKVEKSEKCWIWKAARLPMGYGKLKYGTDIKLAHRVSWEIAHGPIPEGQCVCHKCDNPPCVNPDHLFLGTHTGNMQDCKKKGRENHARGDAHFLRRCDTSQCNASKLTWDQVDEIRNRKTENQHQLANEFNTSQSNIYRILRFKSWNRRIHTT